MRCGDDKIEFSYARRPTILRLSETCPARLKNLRLTSRASLRVSSRGGVAQNGSLPAQELFEFFDLPFREIQVALGRLSIPVH